MNIYIRDVTNTDREGSIQTVYHKFVVRQTCQSIEYNEGWNYLYKTKADQKRWKYASPDVTYETYESKNEKHIVVPVCKVDGSCNTSTSFSVL